MAQLTLFEQELDALFRQRTDWLRRKIGVRVIGKPPQFSRDKVNAGITKLQDIASNILAHKLAKEEFEKHVSTSKSYFIRGHGRKDKKKKFEKWFNTHFQNRAGLIYAFWGAKRNCIYIGRTGSRGSRPSSHFDKFWFSSVKRVTIFSIQRVSQIPKLECLAIHRFQPARNKNKAATKKWTKLCALCSTHKSIEEELRRVFRIKKA